LSEDKFILIKKKRIWKNKISHNKNIVNVACLPSMEIKWIKT